MPAKNVKTASDLDGKQLTIEFGSDFRDTRILVDDELLPVTSVQVETQSHGFTRITLDLYNDEGIEIKVRGKLVVEKED